MYHKKTTLLLFFFSFAFFNIQSSPLTPQNFLPSLENLNVYTFRPNEEIQGERLSIKDYLQLHQEQKVLGQTRIAIKHPKYQHAAKKTVTAYKGISIKNEDKVIAILCRGFSLPVKLNKSLPQNGGGLLAAYKAFRDDVFDIPVVTFDFKDERIFFNFGQSFDQHCLQFVYNKVVKQNPQAKIILFGTCRGAKTILECTARQPEQFKNVAAIVGESPFFSVKELTIQSGRKYIGFIPTDFLGNYTFKKLFPNYNEKEDDLRAYVHQIPNIPIFITHRKHDQVISNRQMNTFIRQLNRSGHNQLYFYTTTKAEEPHARMFHLPEICSAFNAFLKECDLPCNTELAQEGYTGLQFAKNQVLKIS